MASTKIQIIDNNVYLPAGLDVGNTAVKGVLGGVDYKSPSFIAYQPKGDFDKENQPHYFEVEGVSSFLVGDSALSHSHVVIGDNPSENKPAALPAFLLAMIASITPRLLKQEGLTVRVHLLASLQSKSLQEKTLEALEILPSQIEITKFGRTFVLDVDYLRENLQLVVEGHYISRIAAAKKGDKKTPVLLVDVGGRTVHFTYNDEEGFSANGTQTLEQAGALALFESLIAEGKVQKLIRGNKVLTPNKIAELLLVENPDEKLVKLVEKAVKAWLVGEQFACLWDEVADCVQSGKLVVFAGGGSGLPGFRDAIADTFKKQKLSKFIDQIVYASDLQTVAPDAANAVALGRVAENHLKKALK